MTEGAGRNVIKSALTLSLVALAGTSLLAGMHHLTAERIAAQERRVVMAQLEQILPSSRYDNDLAEDTVTFRANTHFPRGQLVTAHRARKDGQAVAVILRFRAVDGYNGDIHLLAGILADGSLAGVRVVSHKETPGLGDGIEAERSDWIRGFDGKSLRDPGPGGWAVKRDGGAFDQFTGATITPRAIVDAVHAALEYYRLERELLFSLPSDEGAPPRVTSE